MSKQNEQLVTTHPQSRTERSWVTVVHSINPNTQRQRQRQKDLEVFKTILVYIASLGFPGYPELQRDLSSPVHTSGPTPGVTHIRGESSHLKVQTRQSRYRHATDQPDLDKSSLGLSSQVILRCIELTVKTNQQRATMHSKPNAQVYISSDLLCTAW